jgi:hypothetical protein
MIALPTATAVAGRFNSVLNPENIFRRRNDHSIEYRAVGE